MHAALRGNVGFGPMAHKDVTWRTSTPFAAGTVAARVIVARHHRPLAAAYRSMNEGQASPSIVLVDDTATYRLLLRETLRKAFPASELRDFSSGEQAMAACLERPPDLLVTDLRLRSMDGRGLVRGLWERGCRPRAVVLTAYPESGLPGELLALGVAGFVDKSSPMEQVAHAVQCVWQGGMHFSATVPPPMPVMADPALPWGGADSLSEREREVVRLVVRGLLSKQIAAELGLSTRTVEKHRARICAKLGMHDVPTLVRWSLRNGLG